MAGSCKKVNCPACGAPAENVNRFAAMAVCEYCGAGFNFDDDTINAMGKMAIMVESSSPLYLGATGTIKERRFTIAGRLRYRYPDGFWDEWCLNFEDSQAPGWLSESEGEFSLRKEVEKADNIPAFNNINTGDHFIINQNRVSVDEKNNASLEGAEGSIPFVISKDTTFKYIEASAGEITITIEYAEDGPEVYIGQWVDESDIILDNPREEYDEDGWFDA